VRDVSSISATHLENRERIQPNDTNNYGSAHGGNIIRWMDEIGALAAMRHAGETCVTAHVSDLDFKRPIPQGDTCVVTAYAYATKRTSIRVRLQAFHEAPRTGDQEQTTDSYFVFVAVDEDGTPTPVPQLTVETERCEELRAAALDPDTTTSSYADPLIFLFMSGFFIAMATQCWDLYWRIALRTIRAIGTGPSRIILGFMVATAFLSMWVSNTATTMMMTPIGLAVILQTSDLVDRTDADVPTAQGEFRFGTGLMLCIAYSASVGGVATTVGTPPNLVLVGAINETSAARTGRRSRRGDVDRTPGRRWGRADRRALGSRRRDRTGGRGRRERAGFRTRTEALLGGSDRRPDGDSGRGVGRPEPTLGPLRGDRSRPERRVVGWRRDRGQRRSGVDGAVRGVPRPGRRVALAARPLQRKHHRDKRRGVHHAPERREGNQERGGERSRRGRRRRVVGEVRRPDFVPGGRSSPRHAEPGLDAPVLRGDRPDEDVFPRNRSEQFVVGGRLGGDVDDEPAVLSSDEPEAGGGFETPPEVPPAGVLERRPNTEFLVHPRQPVF
jgi:acyl-CoA hydrolase